jgi:hypothetical protein
MHTLYYCFTKPDIAGGQNDLHIESRPVSCSLMTKVMQEDQISGTPVGTDLLRSEFRTIVPAPAQIAEQRLHRERTAGLHINVA